MKYSAALLRSTTTLALFALASHGVDAFRSGNVPSRGDAKVNVPVLSEPPMPFKWPVVGTLPDFFSRGGVDGLCDVHESMYREYGSVYAMSLMGDDEIVFSDPRVFDSVLRREGRFPVGGAETVTTFSDYYRENGMAFAMKGVGRGPEWKEWRSEINPDMYVAWGTYLPVIAETCAKISGVAGRETAEAGNLHFADFLSRAAFDMFSAVLYGESPETTDTTKATAEDVSFVRSTKRAFDITGRLMINPLDKLMGSDLYKEFVVNMDETILLSTGRGMERVKAAMEAKALRETTVPEAGGEAPAGGGCPIAAVKRTVGLNPNPNGDQVSTNSANPSYIERLVNRDSLSPEDIAETQAPLLMAGVDTTAYVMGWFYLNMASNPEVQAKLAEELHRTLGGADVATVEQMESLTYLKACFRESHRLTPPEPISIKTLEEDVVVDDPAGGRSYAIPAGTRISLNLRGMPMDPAYVDDPADFAPERFSPGAVASRVGTPSAVALDHPGMDDPFGRGKRRCVGANVAVAEMTVLAARLLQDWEVSLADPDEATRSPSRTWRATQKLMLVADPYPAMRLTPRQRR